MRIDSTDDILEHLSQDPEKIVTAYKLFRTKTDSGELFPLFVDADVYDKLLR